MSASDLALRGGQIVLADWRGDALPREPNKRRPAVVVEDERLFVPEYPNVLLVPLTTDPRATIAELCVALEPTLENGCAAACWAVSHLVTTTSTRRVQATRSWILPEQLTAIRRQIASAIGIG